MKVAYGQMCLDLFKPEVKFLCDKCRHLIWHLNGDGYCCCTAPGMDRISAKHRKPMDSTCRFFEVRK